MPNPSGANGDPVYAQHLPFGDRKRQGDLQRSAPSAGQPAASSALDAPRRAQRNAVEPQPPHPGEPLAPGAAPSVLYQQIAEIPGVTPVWSQLG